MTDPRPQPAPNIALLTFLFTDIEGSTARWEAQREAMSLALPRHDAILRAAIEERGGTVFKTVGDAFCAVFVDAEAALAAALSAQRALAAEDWSAFGGDFAELRVRMGIHYGPAEARGGDYFGPALNRTARLMAAGHGGQVLLSEAAQQVLRGHVPEGASLRDLGEHRLKDLRHSEHLWQVVASDLADVLRSPTTAGELTARDRIVVAEAGTSADEEGLAPTVVERSVAETLAALHSAIRRDTATVVLTADQLLAAARHRPADLAEYRLGRIAEWSQPRYRVDARFVALTLLIDQGEEAAGGRWAAKGQAYSDLGALLGALPDPAIVVLGPPGAGKSTLLRRLEMDRAIAGLRGEDARDTVTFFIQLNHYKGRGGQAPADPGDWLAAEWAERYPALPGLDTLLQDGRVVLLLDALNEMPTAGEREFRERLGLWKDWLVRLAQSRPGNRVLFSCRTLDYSAPLSTPALRVPQVQIEALSDEQVHDFLRLYSPVRGEEIWEAIAGTPQVEALRAPFFLALLVDQVEATGEVAADRAGLFTGFVRQALRREVERGSPLFALEELLTGRDLRRIAQWQWRGPYELPERGELIPKLESLAYGMQAAAEDGGASQVRVDLDRALELLDTRFDEDIVRAGVAIAVLDEDPAADEVLYRHQLVQEYFAARELAEKPDPELMRAEWRTAAIHPSVPELLATLPPSETLPPLPQTGWEETTLLAAAMTADRGGFLRCLMATNLALAGRAAGQPELRGRLDEGLLTDLRQALMSRGRDKEADLRHRIACLEALGVLGDPRWERCQGPHGAYLKGPLVEIPGGAYPLGDDEPITWDVRGNSGTTSAHMPRHEVTVAAFRMARYPVTHAEYGCFLAAGGYQDERWWETEDARRWLRGEIANEGSMQNNRHWRQRLLTEESLFQRMEEEGGFPSEEALERWRRWITLDEESFEVELREWYKGTPQTEPAYWRDERFSGPTQPVVGVCWYEARAYAAWLSAQTGEDYRLPTEAEWEAATRGREGRAYAWGDDHAPERANTIEMRLRRTTPVGALVEGETPEGLSDLSGNVEEWTTSVFGESASVADEEPDYGYPYRADDGREDVNASTAASRGVRGGTWNYTLHFARAAYRDWNQPYNRNMDIGFRVVCGSLVSPGL